MAVSKMSFWTTYIMLGVVLVVFGLFGWFLYTASQKDPAFAVTSPMKIDGVVVQASIAKTLPERIRGLSGTKSLPKNVVKLFVFNSPGQHSIWMKDMNYAIDILWVDDLGKIVHIEREVSPETYPEAFTSPSPAYYVIETKAGFTKEKGIEVGEIVDFPK